MANKNITIELSTSSIRRAINIIERRKSWVERKSRTLVLKLAKLGQRVAQGQYGNVANVTIEEQGNVVILRADGEAVCFFEFGAGMKAGSNVPVGEYESIPFDVRPGSWSEEHAQQFSTTYNTTGEGYWIFGGRTYTEIVPRMGMHKAYKRIIRDAEKIAKGVFNSK